MEFCYKGRVCIPNNLELKEKILKEVHQNKYSVHLGNTKIVHNLHQHYWWNGMKMMFLLSLGVLTCQQVKAEHQQPVGTLQSLPIPEWK